MTRTGGRLAVIPARGGSKRLPAKNVREMSGRPLIAYTIEAALESALFDRVVVTTDSPAIADAARSSGAEVPFLRDASLSDDVTPVSLATLDALERLDPGERTYGVVAQLMANCPLRTAGDVGASSAAFEASDSPAQISVTRFGWQNPWWAMRLGDGGRLDPLFADQLVQRSQDLPELFCPTGAIWWAEAGALRRGRTFHLAGRTGWEIPFPRGVDIDTAEDWEAAELFLRLERERRGRDVS